MTSVVKRTIYSQLLTLVFKDLICPNFFKKLEYDIASDVRELRESIQLNELKSFTIVLSMFIVVNNDI